MISRIIRLPRRLKYFLTLTCDLVLLPLALWSSIALRFGTFHPAVDGYFWIFVIVPAVTALIFIRLGLYRTVVRFMDDQIIYTILSGVTLSVLILTAIALMAKVEGLPRSSIIIFWFMAVAYISASRFIARGIFRRAESGYDRKQNVAIYGAGRAGLQTALALMSGPEFRPVAFFDDKKDLHKSFVAGIKVYDSANAIQVMSDLDCNQLLLAIPSASRSVRKAIIQRFEGKNITLKTLPGIGDLVFGTVRIEDIREVGVEDLLGRDTVPPYPDLISACNRDKVVMVTGAGGSIGAELCRQIFSNLPKKIILYERNEFVLYKIEQDLKRIFSNISIVPVLGDVNNEEQLAQVISEHQVDTIYHAAAYKHVPLVEANIIAGVENNVFGTETVARIAVEQKVKTFILISTDKAVRPTNIMGATKRLSEIVLQTMASRKNHQTRFCIVRFGNVLGSSGSVVPLFREQIKFGGPVTVTHPDVTRYFMTIPEAAQLVLQAAAMGSGGDVFVLDMGESVKIVDLAKKMIELSGLEVRNHEKGTGDIAIEFVGLRPGEKLYEELLIGNNVGPTAHPCIMRAEEEFPDPDYLASQLSEMKNLCRTADVVKVKTQLKTLVKEYVEAKV
jgi:FlaA1/EpsC-like NDP-sugar epimerase